MNAKTADRIKTSKLQAEAKRKKALAMEEAAARLKAEAEESLNGKMQGEETDRILMRVGIHELKPAPHNPPSRTTGPALLKLKESLELHGMIYPILADSSGNVLDGHRRLQCAIDLGWKEVDVLIEDRDSNAVYAEVNKTPRRMDSREQLYVYSVNPAASFKMSRGVTPEYLAGLLGDDFVREMVQKGMGGNLYRTARNISSYCETPVDKIPEFVRALIRWMHETKSSKSAREAMEDMVPPQVFREHVGEMKPLRRGWGER